MYILYKILKKYSLDNYLSTWVNKAKSAEVHK